MQTVKIPIGLGGCPERSESLQGAHVILLVLSCGGSIFLLYFTVNRLGSNETPFTKNNHHINKTTV